MESATGIRLPSGCAATKEEGYAMFYPLFYSEGNGGDKSCLS
jgi:hypothetical protein